MSKLADSGLRHEGAVWLRERILELSPRPRSFGIFGSFAEGTLQDTSDLDLLLIGDAFPRKLYKRSEWFSPVIDAWRSKRPFPTLPRTLSPLFLSEQGWLDSIGLRLSLCTHAWILLDDGFLSQSLLQARSWLDEGKWTRKDLRDGGWLWIPRGDVA